MIMNLLTKSWKATPKPLKRTPLKKIGKRTRKWQAFRQDFLSTRKNEYGLWDCEDCGISLSSPDVHHLKSRGSRADLVYDPKNLVILCRPDHQRRHGQR